METSSNIHVDPVIVCTKGSLVRAVEEGVERALNTARSEWEREREVAPGFDWVTNERAMELLSLSRATMARYRKSGKLASSKVGSSIYYRLADIEGLLQAGMQRNGTTANGEGAG